MGRPPTPLGTWGNVKRSEIAPGRWRARARYRDFDGVTRPVERFAKTGAAAERALVEALRDRTKAGAAHEINPDTTLGNVADVWIKGLREGGKHSETTINLYQSAIDVHIKPALSGVRVREASVGTLERFFGAIGSIAVAKRCRVVLTGMMGMCARHDAIDHNPVRETTQRVKAKADRKPVRALTLPELAVLRLNVATWSGGNNLGPSRAEDLPDLFDVFLGTSGRIGEVLAIRKGDINLDGETPTLEFTGTIVGSKRQGYGKTAGSHHIVVLPAFTVAAIERQLARDLPTDQDLLFPSRNGGPRMTNNVRRQLREARGKEFDWVTPHTFRKTAATIVNQNFDLEAAAAQLGHSSSRVTLAHYIERAAQAPDVRSALDLLAPLGIGT